MQYNDLGRTGIRVSRICMGTMTFGGQNTEAEAFRLMDMCADHGVNFYDSAEMYAFPANPKTQGLSEEILGSWIKARGNRADTVIATKITGPGARFGHIRGGDLKFTRRQVADAVDNSLKRLGTDYIDLYQTHWPERKTNYFGQLGYAHDPSDAGGTPIDDVVDAMQAMIDAGKIRAFGVSNETPWGVMKHLEAAGDGAARICAIQNPYSLLNRTFEVGLAEIAVREDVGLFGYSPLGFGALTGKYLGGALPQGSRLQLFPDFKRNFKPRGIEATEKYVALARAHDIAPAAMAIAFVNSRPFLTSNIIGATNEDQLAVNLSAEDLVLSDDVLAGIEAIHNDIPNPAP
ncbi:MAG: aldo/keto reductase [Rhodospirillales bacterium]|nr:aldo/keto reductase [Rhodospirillales bacterium]MBO6787781.1 aldo/keto reductase [Rhodospirillales bacterium]